MPLSLQHRTAHVRLDALTAAEARREITQRWPTPEVEFIGLDRNGEAVFISWVRKRGDNRYVPTALVPDAEPAVRFIARIPVW